MANIGEMVQALKDGKRARRAGWNGKGMELFLVRPVEHPGDEEGPQIMLPVGCEDVYALKQDPFVVMKTAQGSVIPWLCSQADLLADDWEIFAR